MLHGHGLPGRLPASPKHMPCVDARTQASAVYLVQQGSNIYTDKTWRAPMATCILSSLLVIAYDIMSCITLVK